MLAANPQNLRPPGCGRTGNVVCEACDEDASDIIVDLTSAPVEKCCKSPEDIFVAHHEQDYSLDVV